MRNKPYKSRQWRRNSRVWQRKYIMVDHRLLVTSILVAYNPIGQKDEDLEYPTLELPGTLILDVRGEWFVKLSDSWCRRANPEELEEWDGLVSPWYKASLYPRAANNPLREQSS